MVPSRAASSPMMPEAVTKVLLYVPLLIPVGAATAYWFLVPCDGVRNHEPPWPAVEGHLRRCGVAASTGVLGALILRAWAHTAASFGLSESFSSTSLAVIAVHSRWGGSWRLQMIAASASVLAYAFVRERLSWVVAAAASIALACSVPLVGHAAGAPERLVLHAAHVIGAGAWLGTLAVLMMLPRGTVSRESRHLLFRRFSRVAMTGAFMLVATGLIAAYLYVGQFGNVLGTEYGVVLLVKLAAFCGVAVCGYANWKRVHGSTMAPVRVAIIELALTAGVIGITGFLTEIAHP